MSNQTTINTDAEKSIPEGYPADLYRVRHSLAHVMAQAVVELYPEAKYAIGPPIEDGFYYDFKLPRALTEDDLAEIQALMKKIVKGRHAFTPREVEVDEAHELFKDQPFKIELIDALAAGEESDDGSAPQESEAVKITVYEQSGFLDLCRGPHVEHTGQIKANAFKLLNTAGAYWRGDSAKDMLTRIYGTAWRDKGELDAHLAKLADAKKRDHRRLGRDLELFTKHPLVGSGFPVWLPKGSVVRHILEEYIIEEERLDGYQHVYTPDVGKKDLYEVSGHWEHYQEDMFPPMELENETLVLRPMTCPHHTIVYGSKLRSYRDLPIRIAELGKMYRFERSGVVSGLSRVRCMVLNDAHIFCRPDQVKEEFAGVVRLVERAYKTLGITEYGFRLSLRDPANKAKYVDNDEMWELGERVAREAMNQLGVPYVESIGEAAFYGPKLDIQLRDVMGREETFSTVQVDFHLPNQFDLEFIGEDSKPHRPVMIHRAVISTMERMMAHLIEHYAGAFPPWLAPVQCVFVPITDRHVEFCRTAGDRLITAGFRVEVDDKSERMNLKIRNAQVHKVPYILVVGDKEMEAGGVAVRLRTGKDLGLMPLDNFETMLREAVSTRSLTLEK